MKYILSYNTRFGSVSAESKDPKALAGAYEDLRKIAESIEEGKSPTKAPKVSAREEGKRGSGETATILREIEGRLLNTNFFSKPRTTGETRDRLEQASRKSFTSRKVSQALGILWQKKSLKRVGSRNYYTYSK